MNMVIALVDDLFDDGGLAPRTSEVPSSPVQLVAEIIPDVASPEASSSPSATY